MFKKNNDKKNKNKKLVGDTIRLRIHRLVGNMASEIAVLDAEIKKDDYKNSIIIHESDGFKEEFPGIVEPIISDIMYKLESYGLSKEQQINKVQDNIKKKEIILSKVKNGRVMVKKKDSDEEEEILINVETEKANLRLLKVVEYTLTHKNNEGSFEKIEVDGTRCISYLISNGELTPYWFNSPTSNGEPVTLTPDMSLRKKYFYDNEKERLDDLKDMIDTPINKILKTIIIALFIAAFLGNIGWTVYLAKWSGNLHDDALQPQLDKLNVQISQAKQDCIEQLSSQVTNNAIIIDWATIQLEKDLEDLRNKKENNGVNSIKI